MILETTFETAGGSVQLVDFLALEDPADGRAPRAVRPNEVVARMVRGLNGRVRMAMHFEPRFAYGDVTPWIRRVGSAVEAIGGPDALSLTSSVPLSIKDGCVCCSFTAEESETIWFLATYRPSYIDNPMREPLEGETLLRQTERFWREWCGLCTYRGERRNDLMRSLLTLKALTYSPTGGVVAAPTTSLPDSLGGIRNWDCRYCWLRDATFVLDTFLEQGYREEAREWRAWLTRAVAGHPRDLQTMYGLMGERSLTELEAPWLDGYRSSRPVRIGNAAHSQFQLGVYGEVMDCFHSARGAGIGTSRDKWELDRRMVDFVCENWRKPDEGIWEMRSNPRNLVHSKVMAWVAIDRGVKAIKSFGLPGPLEKWRSTRDQIKWQVLTMGVNKSRGCFKRAYDDEELDASLLMLPQVGFISAHDPLMSATVEAIQSDLMEGGMVLRYRTEHVDDGLPPGEGAFLICSFWLVNCLVLMDRPSEAGELLDDLLKRRNDLGLMAEQCSVSDGRLLGNFPQASSHVALVHSIMAVERAGKSRTIRRGA
jgi:GH15 family glucan-1,4-alpha-glucosidase